LVRLCQTLQIREESESKAENSAKKVNGKNRGKHWDDRRYLMEFNCIGLGRNFPKKSKKSGGGAVLGVLPEDWKVSPKRKPKPPQKSPLLLKP